MEYIRMEGYPIQVLDEKDSACADSYRPIKVLTIAFTMEPTGVGKKVDIAEKLQEAYERFKG